MPEREDATASHGRAQHKAPKVQPWQPALQILRYKEQDRTQKLHQLQHHRRQVINNYDKTSLSSSSSLIQQLVTG